MLTDRELRQLAGRLAEELEQLKFKLRMYAEERDKVEEVAQMLRHYETDLYH